MELKQLYYFTEICRTNSFSEAARNCYISAQGINVSIARLEKELGAKLLNRTSQGVFPTQEGEYLLPKAQIMLQIAAECEDYFARKATEIERVNLYCVRGTVEMMVKPAIYEFKELFPDIEIDLKVGSDMECKAAVLNGTADLGLCTGPITAPSLTVRNMYETRCVLFVNKNHPYSKKESVGIEDMASIPLAIPERSHTISNNFLQLCQKKGFTPNYSYIDEPRMASYLADMNLRCGITSLVSAEKLGTENTVLVPFREPEMKCVFQLIRNKERKLSHGAAELEKCILKVKKTLKQ